MIPSRGQEIEAILHNLSTSSAEMDADQERNTVNSSNQLPSAIGDSSSHVSGSVNAASISSGGVCLYLSIQPSVYVNEWKQIGPQLLVLYHGDAMSCFEEIHDNLRKAGMKKHPYLHINLSGQEALSLESYHQIIDHKMLQNVINLYRDHHPNTKNINIKATFANTHVFGEGSDNPQAYSTSRGISLGEKVALRLKTAIENASDQDADLLKKVEIVNEHGQVLDKSAFSDLTLKNFAYRFNNKRLNVSFQLQNGKQIVKTTTKEILSFIKNSSQDEQDEQQQLSSSPSNQVDSQARKKKKQRTKA